MPDEACLREQAKAAIQNGKLPSSIRCFAAWEFERGKAGQS
jgi:hypothetical protein